MTARSCHENSKFGWQLTVEPDYFHIPFRKATRYYECLFEYVKITLRLLSDTFFLSLFFF